MFETLKIDDVKGVDQLLEKWNKDHHDINKPNEVGSFIHMIELF